MDNSKGPLLVAKSRVRKRLAQKIGAFHKKNPRDKNEHHCQPPYTSIGDKQAIDKIDQKELGHYTYNYINTLEKIYFNYNEDGSLTNSGQLLHELS